MVLLPRRALILALAAWLAAPPAAALFQKSQADLVDAERRFDSEYFLDLLGFSPPMSWDDAWAGSTAAYRINGASLDCCDLLLRQELKFSRPLTPGLDFSFRLVQNGDKDQIELHHFLELEKTLAGGFAAQLFGEPTPAKEDADIGVGLAWSPRSAPGLRLAVRRTWVDFVFNQRGSTSQSYTRKPLTDEARAQWSGRNDRAWAALEFDHPLRRAFPDEGRLYFYRRTTARAGWRRTGNPFGGQAEYAYEFLREGDLRNPDPGSRSVDHRRQVHSLDLRADALLGDKDRLEGGALLLNRAARSDFVNQEIIGVFYRRWELQPHLRWFREISPRWTLELGALLALGENRRRFPSGRVPSVFETTAEAKLDAAAEFRFSSWGRLSLVSNLDLDSPARFWDGGGVRALFVF